MFHQTHPLAGLRRPRLLVRAARFGLSDYRRERDLGRLMALEATPHPGEALPHLMEEETGLNERRRAGDAAYSPARHIEVLVALIAEAQATPVARIA